MENVNASTSTRRMTTKIDRKVASNERMLSTKSQNLLKKNVISPFPRDLRPPNLTEWWLMIRATNYKVTRHFNQEFTWGHVTKNIGMRPMVTKIKGDGL